MVSICFWFGLVCRTYFYTSKMWNKKTDSDVVTGIRTIIVLLFSWLMGFIVGSQNQISAIDGKTLLFLILSGLATGASWLCYYRALQDGLASASR
mgnify:CR=1 FL=1